MSKTKKDDIVGDKVSKEKKHKKQKESEQSDIKEKIPSQKIKSDDKKQEEKIKESIPKPSIESSIDIAKEEIEKSMANSYPDIKHDDGKKLRGALSVIISDCFGGNHDKSVRFGAAVEFLHNGSIIHDDILDGHETRRGRPSRVITDGIKKALLIGDVHFATAIRLGAESGSEEALAVSKAMHNVLSGAIKEINLENMLDTLIFGGMEEDIYYKIIDMKTAALFACAAQFGVMAYTDKKSFIDDFFNYGMFVGEAYQVADDLVDISKLADGTKEVVMANVVPLIPAIIKYNHSFIKSLPFKALTGRIGMDTLVEGLLEVDLTSKMLDEIKLLINQSDQILDNYTLADDCLVRQYSKYAVNKMLSEVGEKI